MRISVQIDRAALLAGADEDEINVEASVERFCEQVEEKLDERFPGSVTVSAGDTASVVVELQEETADDVETAEREESIARIVQDVTDDVFNALEWPVEAGDRYDFYSYGRKHHDENVQFATWAEAQAHADGLAELWRADVKFDVASVDHNRMEGHARYDEADALAGDPDSN